MRGIHLDDLRELLEPHEPPCISLYQPTHRCFPENQQDPIRFRNLIKNVEESLGQKYPGREIRDLIAPLEALATDQNFWNHTLDGLAVLGDPSGFRVFGMPRSVPERVVVSDTFHTKPLLRFLQSADRYQVLCLSRDRVQLLEGNRDALGEVELGPEVVEALDAALAGEDRQRQGAVTSAGDGGAIHYGQGGRKDAVDTDTERFFRAVDRAITEKHSKPSGLPLLLATLPQHVDTFRSVSRNPFLLNEVVAIDPWSLSTEKLCAEAWKRVEPAYLQRLHQLKAEFEEAASKKMGSGDLADIAQAVAGRRVKSLLIEADRTVAGRLDAEHGRITFDELADPEIDDLLDDLAEAVIRTGGEVVVVPADQMPTSSGAAAVYRF